MLHAVPTGRKITAWLAVSLAACLASPGAVLGAGEHDFSDLGCDACHTDIDRESATGRTELREDIDARCVKCHQSCTHGRKHAGGEAGSQGMKVILPLGPGHRMACYTCHDPHLDAVDAKTKLKTTYLRINNLKRQLCLNCHSVGSKATGRLKVIYPPSAVIVRGGYTPLLGKAEGLEGGYLTATINGSPFNVKLRPGGAFYLRLKIDEGLNQVRLSDGPEVLWTGEIYGSGDKPRTANYGMISQGHQTNSREECLGCHRDSESFGLVDATSQGELCRRCHPPARERRFLHGPLAAGECLPCHDPHGGSDRSYLRAGGDDLCLGCHNAGEIDHRRGDAGGGGTCLGCHDPHQSDTWYLGRMAGGIIKSELSPPRPAAAVRP